MAGDDAVDEEKLVLCCALCCHNCSVYPAADCLGCSGKVGLCCLNMEFCCKPGAPCLPCGCCGPQCEMDGCSCFNMQAHCCCCVNSAAFPCNDEVPAAVTILGLTLYPKCGCMVPMKEIMNR
ncbi:hypothetical protein ACHAWO_009035 [Cyclotella atomus]|uniref:Uncharacterized protein n=1 Tax=Cyclotella atomus TaxID=382360 RepID=A0ABD3QXP1_9STRA